MVGRDAPDLAVLDLALPDLSGREVLAEMRAHPATATTPVLIVTGFPGEVTGCGPQERLLVKPFTYLAFVQVLEAPDRGGGAATNPEPAAAERQRPCPPAGGSGRRTVMPVVRVTGYSQQKVWAAKPPTGKRPVGISCAESSSSHPPLGWCVCCAAGS